VSSQTANPSRRRTLVRVLLIFIAFFGTMWIFRFATASPKYRPKYQTIAHRFLDLESQYVTIPDESYELLDDLITAAKSNTHYDPSITNPAERAKQLLLIFNRIDALLTQNNFIFPAGEPTGTLGESLDSYQLSSSEMEAELAQPHNARREAQMRNHADDNFHLIACVPNAFLYMGMAEAIGFDLKPVLAPVHMFVRAPIDQTHWINYDPNRGRTITDREYVRDWGVETWQIRDKIFMHSLSDDEIEAEMYTAIGAYLTNHDEWRGRGPAIECYRKALELNPREDYADAGLASTLLFTADPNSSARAESLKLAQRAVEVQPNEGCMHRALAYALAANDQTTAAVEELRRAIELDPKDNDAPYMIPMIQSGYSMYGARRAAYPIRYWICYEHGWLWVSVPLIAGLLGAIIWLVRRVTTDNTSSNEPTAIPALAMLQNPAGASV
jgi:regulator of sirC expression with transglutaminase-like and TPR domain